MYTLVIKSIAKIYARAIHRGAKTIKDVVPETFQDDVRAAYLEIFGEPCPEVDERETTEV